MLSFLFGGFVKKVEKWKTLEHSGPILALDYVPHKTEIQIGTKKIILPKEAEEFATLYAKIPSYKKTVHFQNNFWNDFKLMLPSTLRDISIEEINFDSFSSKKSSKFKKQVVEINLNGKKFTLNNYFVEPPGIFMGRGNHPLSGKIKKRVEQKDITLNGSKIYSKKNFKVIYDRSKAWIASWRNNITGKRKYIFPGDALNDDKQKFDFAKSIDIENLRKKYFSDYDSPDIMKRQLACAVTLIDFLALRVGNRKGENESKTMGVSTLTKSSIKLLPHNEIELDFLSKDSIRYNRKFKCDIKFYKLISDFMKCEDKKLFHLIDSKLINEYLDSLMKGLTSKVLRTRAASKLFQDMLYDSSIQNPKERFISANRAVAILCNHKNGNNLNLSTSLKNYIDPRIVYSYSIQHNLPLSDKVEWAKVKHFSF